MEEELLINNIVRETAKILDDNKAENTYLFDFRRTDISWASFAIVTTARSNLHMRGLSEEVKKFLIKEGFTLRFSQSSREENGWLLIDAGDFTVNIMDSEAREFYDLEHLWFQTEAEKL